MIKSDLDKLLLILGNLSLIFMIVGLFSLFLFVIYDQLEDIKNDIQICKDLGYDGVAFVNKHTNQVECSNFTDLERAKRGINND